MVPSIYLYDENNELLDHVLIGQPVQLPDYLPLSAMVAGLQTEVCDTKLMPINRPKPIHPQTTGNKRSFSNRSGIMIKSKEVRRHYVLEVRPSEIIRPHRASIETCSVECVNPTAHKLDHRAPLKIGMRRLLQNFSVSRTRYGF
jgi:hypothetical protein